MRLIQLIANHNRHPTGMTTVFASIVAQAVSRGWTPEIVVPTQAESAPWVVGLAAAGAVVHVVPFGGTLGMARRISEVIGRGGEPALVHTHLTTYDMPAALACASRREVGLIWHVHSVLPPGRRLMARTRLKFGVFGRRVDRVVIPFENTRADLVRRGVDPKRIVEFPGCIDPAEYPPASDAERDEARRAMGIDPDTLLLLHFGWHWYEKGGDEFMGCVRLLVDAGLPVKGLTNRGGEAAERSRSRFDLEDVVEIGGLVHDSRELFVASDCMVGPSRAEGLTFTYLEALATGLPLVATNLEGDHFLHDRLRACIVSSHDPVDIAAGVREILSRSEDERRAAAAEMREWIVDTRTVDPTVSRLLDEYERVMDVRAG